MKTYETTKQTAKQGSDQTSARNEVINGFMKNSAERAYRYAFNLTDNSDQAQELVQEGLFRGLRGWHTYDASKSFDSWLFRIIHNAFLDFRKNYHWRMKLPLDGDSVEGGDSPIDVISDGYENNLVRLEREEDGREVSGLVKKLTSEQKAVVNLSFVAGYSYEEIGQRLRIPAGTVKSRIFRARRILKKRLAEFRKEV